MPEPTENQIKRQPTMSVGRITFDGYYDECPIYVGVDLVGYLSKGRSDVGTEESCIFRPHNLELSRRLGFWIDEHGSAVEGKEIEEVARSLYEILNP